MKLTVYDREIAVPTTRVKTSRDLNIGIQTPQAIGQLGKTLESMGVEIGQKVKIAEETAEYSTAVTEAKRLMSRYYAERAMDHKRYDTLRDDVNKEFNRVSAELLDNIKGKVQYQRVAQGLAEVGLAFDRQATSDAMDMQVTHIKAAMLNTRANMVEEASADSDSFNTAFRNYADILWNYARAGVYEYDDAQKDLINFASDAVRGRVYHLQNTDLDMALEFLLDEKSDARLIDREARERLIASTNRMIETRDRKAEADRRRAEAAEEKALNQARDMIYQNSVAAIIRGELSTGKLDTLMQSNLLHKKDYETLYQMMMKRTKEWTGDPVIYDHMRLMAASGELSVYSVHSAFIDEQLNSDMADELTKMIASGADIVQSADYKNYLFSMKTALGFSPSSGGFANPQQEQLASKATIEFYMRAKAGEELGALYADMMDRYINEGIRMFPRPRYKTEEEAKQNIAPGVLLDNELGAQRWHERWSKPQ